MSIWSVLQAQDPKAAAPMTKHDLTQGTTRRSSAVSRSLSNSLGTPSRLPDNASKLWPRSCRCRWSDLGSTCSRYIIIHVLQYEYVYMFVYRFTYLCIEYSVYMHIYISIEHPFNHNATGAGRDRDGHGWTLLSITNMGLGISCAGTTAN